MLLFIISQSKFVNNEWTVWHLSRRRIYKISLYVTFTRRLNARKLDFCFLQQRKTPSAVNV